MHCIRCGKENQEGAKFCIECGSQITIPINKFVLPEKPKKNHGCISAIIVVIVLVSLFATIGSLMNDDTASTGKSIAERGTHTTTAKKTVKTGIDENKFNEMVKEKLSEIDQGGVISGYQVTVYDALAMVTLYLSDLSYWEISDTEKKEFMNVMGNLMDSIAVITAYPGAETIATSTVLRSPSGLELAERTIWGNVKLK